VIASHSPSIELFSKSSCSCATLQELESEHAAGPGHGGTDVNVDELLDDPELEALHRCDAQRAGSTRRCMQETS